MPSRYFMIDVSGQSITIIANEIDQKTIFQIAAGVPTRIFGLFEYDNKAFKLNLSRYMIHNANEKHYYNQEEPEDAYLIYALRLAGVGEKKLAQIRKSQHARLLHGT